IQTRPRVGGLAQDILTEAEQGNFDALVVGRRGLTRTQELFMGSVSNQLVQHAANVPLWIIDGVIEEPKVLVAVDGSPASLRAVDHIAFMLGQNPEAEVTFLHVLPKFQNYCPIDSNKNEDDWAQMNDDLELLEEEFRRDEQICLSDFFLRATKILGQAGFSQDRIKFEERVISLGVARTIIKTAKDLGCGTIVVGRRGMGKSSFLGGVSDRVIRRVNGLAVWLVN
ncbi:MAG: universal stress protein, partial [Thermodesulfobacteriota bacterium]|nr:universal stress protein [Thermodesulfobacteriota bacterium]